MIELINLVSGRNCLEVGGPSQLLNQFYPNLESISILNYKESMETHSQSGITGAVTDFHYGDSTEKSVFEKLNLINKFDLLVSSHTLEHIANPIKTLMAWQSSLRPGGEVITIVPNKDYCWDSVREYTSIEHIISDFKNETDENDMTHFHESSCMIVSRPGYYLDVGENNKKRIIHHHVFSTSSLQKIHELAGFITKICFVDNTDPLQMIYVGYKK